MILSGEDFVPQETSGNTWKHFQIATAQREETGNDTADHYTRDRKDTAENHLTQAPIGQRLRNPVLNNQIRTQGVIRCVASGQC